MPLPFSHLIKDQALSFEPVYELSSPARSSISVMIWRSAETIFVLQAAKKLFHIPAASSKAVKKSEPVEEEPVMEPTTTAATDIDEETSEAAVVEAVLSGEKQEVEPATFADTANPEEAAVKDCESAEEQIPEPGPVSIVTYEEAAPQEAATEQSASSQQQQSAEALSHAVTVIDQQQTSPQPAATEQAPTTINKEAAHPSPYRRRFIYKGKPVFFVIHASLSNKGEGIVRQTWKCSITMHLRPCLYM